MISLNLIYESDDNQNIPVLKGIASPSLTENTPFQRVFEDLGIKPQDEVTPSSAYDVLGKLRDNENSYQQVWTPWLSRAAVHVAKVSDDGEFLVVGGGYLLDTELHIYRWNSDERQYTKVWEAGSGIITRDVYDVAFGDSDNNNLIEIAAACADGHVYLFEQSHIYDPIANLENRFDFVWQSNNYFQATAVEFYDLDLDGIQDLVVGSWDKRIHIFEYTDHSGYPFDVEHWIELTERWNSTEVDDKIQALGVGDFNNNDLPDIVVGTLSGSIYIFENDGVVMSPHGIEFPFPNDNDYRLIWNNSGLYQPIWNPIGQIATGELDKEDDSDPTVSHPTDAIILAYGQGAWGLHYTDERDFYLEQLIQDFEVWQTQGAYPFDNFADWMIREEGMNWQIFTEHINGSRYPEPWDGKTQNGLDIFSNSAVTGAPLSNHGGIVYDEHEYLLITQARRFEDAKADCELRGGHLVTISDLAENNIVSTLAGSNRIWLGLTDSETYGTSEGNFKWITGEPVTFTRWNSGEPNNVGNEDFVEMYSNGYWNDLPPSLNRYYVCEWEAGENKYSVFSVNNTHRNATGTWNLGAGEELASNGNPDPDLYIIFDDSETVVRTDEWNVSLGNNLVDWHQVDSDDISSMSAGKGLAIDIDRLFAKKKMMSAQYIQLTLLTSAEIKERRVDAIVFPCVARPLTIAASVTIDPLSFSYDETETLNKVVFGGSDGRLLTFQRGVFNITYYRKYRTREAVLTEVPAVAYGIVSPTFIQNWDSYTDAHFNLGETIWSIQGTPKKPLIPSWRYIQGETKEFTEGLYTGLGLHHISRSNVSGAPGLELIITHDGGSPHIINSETGTLDGTATNILDFVTPLSFGIDTFAFGDLYQGDSKDELIIFPWYSPHRRPSSYDSRLLPVIFNWIAGQYQNPTTLSDVDGHLYSYLAESTTYPSATIVDVDNDRLQDIVLSNGRLALLWNIGTTTSPLFKFDFEYFRELNERATSNPIFSPNAWDYDYDGDYDIAYSYGRGSGTFRYGMDFFENHGTPTDPLWARNAYVMKNPTTDGSLRFNNYTAGVIVPSTSNESSAESIWVWNGYKEHLRELRAETDQQNSYIIGTNPELMKLEVNLKQSPPNAINFGYAMVKSWSNLKEMEDWTLTLTTSHNLDGDADSEIIVCDYDNNVYVFEHLIENTYKRAFKTHDLNHTELTDFSPYAFQELAGVSGKFQRTIYDHSNLLTAGFDYNNNGKEEFIVTAGLQVYIFEATGFNDEFTLIFEIDYRNMILDYDTTQFSALAITPDFDGRGSMIALGAGRQLFLLRWDPEIGWLESFQSISGTGFYDQPGNPSFYPTLDIQTMLFADINQDNVTELWIGGSNRSNTLTTHGGVFYKGNEYRLFTEAMTWGAAKAACESLGGHLVTITSQEENDFVQSLAGWRAHIGLYEPSPGNWVWITGEPYGAYTNWGGGQPSNSGGVEDYAEIMMDWNGVWNDIADYHVRQYVCEWEKEKTFVKTNTGFLLALQSDFGNIHHVFDFPSISTHVNTLSTSDSDFDGNLELIIGHGHGIDIWEAQEEAPGLNFTRIDLISSDPNYGNPHGLEPTFDTYHSPVGLAPHAHDVVQIDNGNFFVVYGVEEGAHDPFSGNEKLVDPTNGDGRLYYSLTPNPSILGTIKSQQLFTPPQGVLISEIFYEDHTEQDNTDYHWIELYNPNIFTINLTGWQIGINDQNITIGTDTIGPREYYVISRNTSVFNTRYGSDPDINNTGLEFPSPDVANPVTVNLYRADARISDSVSLAEYISSLERMNQSNVLQTAVIPVDTDSSDDWDPRSIASQLNGSPSVRHYDLTDGFTSGIEYEPTVIQLQNGTILVSWVIAYKNATTYDKCILSRTFDRDGNPISKIRLIERISSPPADTDTQIRGLGLLEIDNGTDNFVFYCYTKTNTTTEQGNVSLQVNHNGILSDNSANLGLDNYFIHSVDLFEINGRLGIIFAGHPKNTFYSAQQLYFTTLNRTYHNQGIFPITSGVGNARFPCAATMATYSNRIAVLYERITGGRSEVVSIFSSDSGVTWSDSYVLNSDDPYLSHTGLGFITENGTSVLNRQNYRPRLTDDGTGGIIYQFVSRFLIPVGDDNYSGNIYNHDGVDHNFVTQLWVVQIEKGHWFKFTDILDVTAIAVGDSDNDLRTELFIGHDYRVSLLEVTHDNSYTQKWQYQPPSYVSLHPELINSTFAEFFVSDTVKPREVGAVAIFDGNRNGWPELIFSVRGGDVYSFEVTNLEQPINDLYAITEEYIASIVPAITSATDVWLTDINGGELDLVISDDDGISAWDIESNSSLWNYATVNSVEKIYEIEDSLGNPFIIGITSTGIFGINLDGSERYWIDAIAVDTTNSHLLTDVNGDTIPDVIVATTTEVSAIEPVTGEIIWVEEPDNSTQNEGYFDIAAGKIGTTTIISVCSGNLSSSIYKQVNILDINGSILQAFNLTHLTQLDTRSHSIIGDFDGDFVLDFGIVNFDNINLDESYLEVYDLSSLYLILNTSLPIPAGLDLNQFPIYARDVNGDTITDIILAVPSFNSPSDLFPSNGYSSGIFAVDVPTQTTIWHRYFTDSLDKFELDSFGDEEVIIAFTGSSGLFALTLSGADILWTDLDAQSVAADITNQGNEQTLIATITDDGSSSIYRVIGMMTKAANTITAQTYIVDTNMKILYSDLASVDYFVLPVIVTNDGTEKLLVAFTNGTLILRSFDRGEIWRIQISPFTSISATGLEIEPGKYGLTFKTDTSDLYILERTTTQIWAQITTSGSIEASFSLDGNSDVLLLQTISGNSGTLSILDPTTRSIIWTYTNPSYFTYLKVECLDPSNIGKQTHIVALDYLGIASLIELPSTTVIGGFFPTPSVGNKWIQVKSIKNGHQLATVVLLSDSGELLRYSWLSNGEISTLSYEITDQDEIISLDVADQVSVTDIMIITPNNGSRVLRDDGSTITVVSDIYNYYNDSLDHHFANIDDTPESEVVFVVHNSLVVFTSEGIVIESHSLPNEIVTVKDWKVDTTMKVAFLTILRDNSIAVADPSNRILSTRNGEAAASDLKDALISEQKETGSSTNNNNGSIFPPLELVIPSFVVCLSIISIFSGVRKRRRTVRNQRRSLS